MLHTEWDDKIKNQTSKIREETIIVTPEKFIELEKYMKVQDKNDDVHILSMNYTISTGELIIKRQYFNGSKSFWQW